MKKADVEGEIFRIYRYEYMKRSDSINASESPTGARHFYEWLKNNHSEVLDYRRSGDKYQDVAGMVEHLRV